MGFFILHTKDLLLLPIEIVKDVIRRCKLNKLRAWESDLKKDKNLSCSKLGETVASIIDAKMKGKGKFSQETKEELYQNLHYIDPQEIQEILNMDLDTNQYGGGDSKDKKKKKKGMTFDIKGREIFAAGTWKKDKYTEKDLDDMIDAFNKLDFKPALKLHHEPNDENDKVDLLNPALGYVSSLYRQGKKLLADFSGIPKKVFEAIQNKAYNRVSSEIAWNFKRNGKIFKRALCGVALLGADIPAVADLDTLNGLYSYSKEDDVHSYDLDEDIEGDEIVVNFGGRLDWEDTKDSYLYWTNKFDSIRNQIDNVEKEDIGDGVFKLFESREIINDNLESETIKEILGWEFMKSDFNLAQAKAWIRKRKDNDIFSEEIKKEESKEFDKEKDTAKLNGTIPESAGDINHNDNSNNKEDKMADEELQEKLNALQKELSDSQEKIKSLEAHDSELENKTKEFSEKEEVFSKEKGELETKLKESEEKEKGFSNKLDKLSEENKKFAEEKIAAEKAARNTEIKIFVDSNKAKGKILPKFEEHIKSLLSIEDENKICKFSVKEEGKEVEKEFSISELVREMIGIFPNMVEFKQLSVVEDINGISDTGDLVDKKTKAYASEHNVKYGEALTAVFEQNPGLKEEYLKTVVN